MFSSSAKWCGGKVPAGRSSVWVQIQLKIKPSWYYFIQEEKDLKIVNLSAIKVHKSNEDTKNDPDQTFSKSWLCLKATFTHTCHLLYQTELKLEGA